MTLDQTTAADLGRITSDLNALVSRLTANLEATGEELEVSQETVTGLIEQANESLRAHTSSRRALDQLTDDHRVLEQSNRDLERERNALKVQLEKTQAARDEYTVGIPDFMRTVRGTVWYLGEDVPAARWGTRVYFARKSGGHLVTEMATLGSVVEQSFRIADLEPFELVARPRSSYGFGFKKL